MPSTKSLPHKAITFFYLPNTHVGTHNIPLHIKIMYNPWTSPSAKGWHSGWNRYYLGLLPSCQSISTNAYLLLCNLEDHRSIQQSTSIAKHVYQYLGHLVDYRCLLKIPTSSTASVLFLFDYRVDYCQLIEGASNRVYRAALHDTSLTES